MDFDFKTLEPLIEHVLSAPGIDLSTISAKRVRKQLAALDARLTSDFLKEHKDEVDPIISVVFERVSTRIASTSGTQGDLTDQAAGKKRKTEEDGAHANSRSAQPVPKRPRQDTKNGKEISGDAELARQLASQLNGRTRHSRAVSGGKRSNGNTSKVKRSKKSAATVDSEGDSDSGSQRRSRGAKGGFAKEYILSPPLAAVLHVEKLSRPQVVKRLWEYIKEKELQNPRDKREILCDDNLKAIFSASKVTMFNMNKYLGQHLHEEE